MTSEQKEAFLNSWFGASEGSDWTHGMAGSFVEIINAQFDQAIQAYTRAVPEVPELDRYGIEHKPSGDDFIGIMEVKTGGKYVLHSQAVEIIAAEQQKTKDADELAFRMDRFAKKYLRHMRNAEQRAEAAEAKLAQYEAQEPVGSRELRGDGTYGWSQYVYKGWQPLYASPAPAADLKAENERLREVLKPFAEYMKDYGDKDNLGNPVPDAQGVGWIYLNHGHFRAARAALNVEASNDP